MKKKLSKSFKCYDCKKIFKKRFPPEKSKKLAEKECELNFGIKNAASRKDTVTLCDSCYKIFMLNFRIETLEKNETEKGDR